MLGRMVHVKSSSGELHYLRLLLLHVRGEHATSFAALQRSNTDESAPSFQELAREMGLLQDDSEIGSMLLEASEIITSTAKLCELLAETFVWLEVSDYVALWEYFLSLAATNHCPVSPAHLYSRVDEILHSFSLSMIALGIQAPAGAVSLSPGAGCALAKNRIQFVML